MTVTVTSPKKERMGKKKKKKTNCRMKKRNPRNKTTISRRTKRGDKTRPNIDKAHRVRKKRRSRRRTAKPTLAPEQETAGNKYPISEEQAERQETARAKQSDRTEEEKGTTPETTTTRTEETAKRGTKRTQKEPDPNKQKPGGGQAHHEPDTLGREIEKMAGGEETQKGTSRRPRSNRSRKILKTMPLPNQTITGNLNTRKTKAGPETQSRMNKVTDDEEATTTPDPDSEKGKNMLNMNQTH